MKRRDFGLFVASLGLGFPCSSRAQQTSTARRIGVLFSYSTKQTHPALGLARGLKELGYTEGHDIILEWRSAEGDAAKFPALAAELVRGKVDVIVAGTNPAIEAARLATRTIPIVMTIATDPVATGFVSNLSRPGGNLSGVSIQSDELAIKRMQLLKEAFPKLSGIAILSAPAEAARAQSVKALERAARELGLHLQSIAVREPAGLDEGFKAIARHKGEAAIISGSTMFFAQRSAIAKLAIKHRVPTLAPTRAYAEAGVLLSYGADFEQSYRRAAFYVDKILKGTPIGELPVEQPTKFELLINASTVKALGIKLPSAVLARADQVVQ